MMTRVVLAMSGGVDSSVAAHLLLEQGYDVVGVFMRHGETSPVACAAEPAADDASLPIVSPRTDHKQGCCTASDAEDARRVSDRLGIPFYALDLKEEFGRIIDYFVAEYSVARTPNPCVMCNNWIKFGKLFDYADAIDAEFVATGHYARLVRQADRRRPLLCRGVDSGKDQSYVLAGVARDFLPRMLLPVGEFDKPTIRRIATEIGLRVADKKDSQEICFVTPGEHGEFVRRRRGEVESGGEIVTSAGEVVGRHAGIENFTIGQRKGLGVAFGEPRYVVRIDAQRRQVVVGMKEELACRQLTASQFNWLVDPPADPFSCQVQIRYNSSARPATVRRLGESQIDVQFDEPADGVAPGQAAVIYQGDEVLGGGWID
ncbi:MAG: tRNA 2-thiouridine(34) synthase MnmA [Planctomycetales bacterium]|nr:tRNA 2-thiouridine(34) synthase MnmA [Planctomycetales bacterium]